MNVTALVNTSGTVVERYLYDPYGQPTITNAGWSVITWANSKKNEILYCGYRWDPESGLYHVRHRSYHPTLGKLTGRDMKPYAREMSLSEYCGSSPTVAVDPMGDVWYKPWTWWSKDDEELTPDEKAAAGAVQGGKEAAQEGVKSRAEEGKVNLNAEQRAKTTPKRIRDTVKDWQNTIGWNVIDAMREGLDRFVDKASSCRQWFETLVPKVVERARDPKLCQSPCFEIKSGTTTEGPFPQKPPGNATLGIAGQCQREIAQQGGNSMSIGMGQVFAAFADKCYKLCEEEFLKAHPKAPPAVSSAP